MKKKPEKQKLEGMCREVEFNWTLEKVHGKDYKVKWVQDVQIEHEHGVINCGRVLYDKKPAAGQMQAQASVTALYETALVIFQALSENPWHNDIESLEQDKEDYCRWLAAAFSEVIAKKEKNGETGK